MWNYTKSSFFFFSFSFFRFVSKNFILLDTFVNGIGLLISVLGRVVYLFVHRNATFFCIMTLHLAMLLSLFINSVNFFGVLEFFLNRVSCQSAKADNFTS